MTDSFDAIYLNRSPDDDPMMAAADAISWDWHQRTVSGLLDCRGLNREGVEYLRHRLRDQEWAGAKPYIGAQHAILLDRVARYLATTHDDLEGPTLDYFREVGDLLPEAPDDISTLPSADLGDLDNGG